MSNEDYKLQVSIKFGRGHQGMLNMRAGSLEELDGLVNGALDVIVPSLGLLVEATNAVEPIVEAFPGTTIVQRETPAGAGGEVPTCVHGSRIYREDKGGQWKAHFCPLDKNSPDRCRPMWIK